MIVTIDNKKYDLDKDPDLSITFQDGIWELYTDEGHICLGTSADNAIFHIYTDNPFIDSSMSYIRGYEEATSEATSEIDKNYTPNNEISPGYIDRTPQ